MSRLNKQSGISSAGWLLILMLGAFALLSFFRMGPAYLDNYYIREALRALAAESEDINNMPKREIRSKLNKYYTINGIRGEATKALEIERLRNKQVINVNYEIRVPLIYNIDVVMKFNNQLDSSKPDACCTPSEQK